MTDYETKIQSLVTLIPKILNNEENQNSFAFFLYKLENIRRPLPEIISVLKEYLVLSENMIAKGKKLIEEINDKQSLPYAQNVDSIDAVKIILIANAVLEGIGIKAKISIYDFKRKYKKHIARSDSIGESYQNFIAKHQKGDVIVEMISPRWTWKQLCGSSLVVLLRDDEFILGIKKSMN